jgi:hypothetical protein
MRTMELPGRMVIYAAKSHWYGRKLPDFVVTLRVRQPDREENYQYSVVYHAVVSVVSAVTTVVGTTPESVIFFRAGQKIGNFAPNITILCC